MGTLLGVGAISEDPLVFLVVTVLLIDSVLVLLEVMVESEFVCTLLGLAVVAGASLLLVNPLTVLTLESRVLSKVVLAEELFDSATTYSDVAEEVDFGLMSISVVEVSEVITVAEAGKVSVGKGVVSSISMFMFKLVAVFLAEATLEREAAEEL